MGIVAIAKSHKKTNLMLYHLKSQKKKNLKRQLNFQRINPLDNKNKKVPNLVIRINLIILFHIMRNSQLLKLPSLDYLLSNISVLLLWNLPTILYSNHNINLQLILFTPMLRFKPQCLNSFLNKNNKRSNKCRTTVFKEP